MTTPSSRLELENAVSGAGNLRHGSPAFDSLLGLLGLPIPGEDALYRSGISDGTFSVYVPDLSGCVSTGTTRDEAVASIREAIAGHIQTLNDLGEPVPLARSQSEVVGA